MRQPVSGACHRISRLNRQMDRVLCGGTAVNADKAEKADIRISGGRIAAVGNGVRQAGDEVLDVSGCYLFPGGIDPHTHFDLDVGSTVTADDFASGTRAALVGGTTTIIDYATQSRGGTVAEALAQWHRKADRVSSSDYGFHLALCDCNPAVLGELGRLPAAGVTSIKLYLAYKNTMQVDDATLFRVMRSCREQDLLLCLHCENGDIIAELTAEAKAAGRFDPAQHAATRPEEIEAEAVNRALCMAELTGCRLYIVHVSSAKSLALIRAARRRGVRVWAETCMQYLLLDASRYQLPGFEPAKYVMSPPLRGRENQEFLWQGLAQGDVSCVGSDHCSFFFAGQKTIGRDDFSRIPNGIPGAENRFGLLYTYGVAAGRISLQTFVSAVSTVAAKLFGLYPRKGILAAGSDADIVVWDPSGRQTIQAATQLQRTDYNPFEGFEQSGIVRHVLLRGNHVVKNGEIDGGPLGEYLPRSATISGEDRECTVLP